MDIILGVKNMFEIEGEVSCRTFQFKFLNRSLPTFPLSTHRIKAGAKAYVKAKGTRKSKAFIQGKFRNYENKTGGQPYCHADY